MIICNDDFFFDSSESISDRADSNRFLILALLVSCLLHFLALLVFPDWRLWKPVSSVNSSLQISLQDFVTKTIEKEPGHQLAEKPVKKIISKPDKNISKNTEVVTTQTNPINIAHKKIELLSRDELNNISIDKDANYSPDDSLAFNPRLKENRTMTRAMPKGGAQEQQLEAWQDIHGNRFYKSGGQCYKATSEAKGISSTEKGTNWYFTSCGGKSESETITDRINQEMKQRFRQ